MLNLLTGFQDGVYRNSLTIPLAQCSSKSAQAANRRLLGAPCNNMADSGTPTCPAEPAHPYEGFKIN
jgi:hypothetical protein